MFATIKLILTLMIPRVQWTLHVWWNWFHLVSCNKLTISESNTQLIQFFNLFPFSLGVRRDYWKNVCVMHSFWNFYCSVINNSVFITKFLLVIIMQNQSSICENFNVFIKSDKLADLSSTYVFNLSCILKYIFISQVFIAHVYTLYCAITLFYLNLSYADWC